LNQVTKGQDGYVAAKHRIDQYKTQQRSVEEYPLAYNLKIYDEYKKEIG
jgi:hypothetical protein